MYVEHWETSIFHVKSFVNLHLTVKEGQMSMLFWDNKMGILQEKKSRKFHQYSKTQGSMDLIIEGHGEAS